MELEYYPIPLNLAKVMKGKHFNETVSIRESIHENIRLILKSFTMTYRYDPTFGCLMNKFHASTPPQGISNRAWRDQMRSEIQKNLKDMLQRYETRIQVKDVFIEIKRRRRNTDESLVNVNVEVHGNLSLGRKEKFHYPDSEITEDAKEILPLLIPIGKN